LAALNAVVAWASIHRTIERRPSAIEPAEKICRVAALANRQR